MKIYNLRTMNFYKKTIIIFLSILFFVCISIIIFFLKPHYQTPYISKQAYPTATQTPTMYTSTILFTGDLMMDRYIREIAMKHGGYKYILANITPFLASYDIVISDLEGPITNNPSISIGSIIGSPANYVFTFDPSITKTLYENNIRLVSIGNNHILNQGDNGLIQTIDNLNKQHIEWFGNANGTIEPRKIVKNIGGITIGFVNFNEFVENGKESVLSDIDSLKDTVDLLIVYAHWGPEYETQAPLGIKRFAMELIDRGADLIIGCHPHVIMNSEIYKGKSIYYSIGNFVMDQYFSPETKKGIVLEISMEKLNNSTIYKTKEHHISMDFSGQTKLISD
jgi:gamma-polyglutamate biosynthesis protein CapA